MAIMILGSTATMAMARTIGVRACGDGTIHGAMAIMPAGMTHGLILGMTHGTTAMPDGMADGTTLGITAGAAGMVLGTGVVR